MTAVVEALVEVTRMTTGLPDISTLATKTDLEGVRTELKVEIAGVRALIATSQVQTIAIVLTGTAAMLALSHLIH